MKGDNEDWRPNLFVPGFAKCGTTALNYYLNQHPSVFMVGTDNPLHNEPGTLFDFWNDFPSWALTRNETAEMKGEDSLSLQNYEEAFSGETERKYRGDCSPVYAYSPEMPERLREFSPDSKAIMLLRDQRERLLSLYYFLYPSDPMPFSDLVDRVSGDIDSFLYLKTVESYYEAFGDDLLVVESGSLKNETRGTMDEIFRFLDIESVEVDTEMKNIGIFSPGDSESYRKVVMGSMRLLASVSRPVGIALRRLGIYDTAPVRFLRRNHPVNILKKLFTLYKSGKKDYREGIEEIPSSLADRLDSDYKETVEFCEERGILLDLTGGETPD